MNDKIIVVLGPTASGKTSLAIDLAKKVNGEIICVDSRSVYRGLDIGTAKPYIDKKHKLLEKSADFGPVYEIDGITHYALDIANPKKDYYSVSEFQKLSYALIKKIINKGKIPFLVGGTGLYLNAITKGYQFPKFSKIKREKIEKVSDKELIKKLKKVDPKSVEKHKDNRRRLIRALEVYELEKKPISAYKNKKPPYDFLYLAIDWPREELYKRIDKWVDMRIDMGMLDEAKKLHDSGISYKRMDDFGLEYRYLANYLKDPTKENLKIQMQDLKYKIHAFARRQLTWFRKNKEIHWLKPDDKLNQKAYNLTKKFLDKK